MNPFDNELQPIKLNNLKKLKLFGHSSLYKLTSICSYAFYECNQIELINLASNNINYISKDAFHFRCENDKKLIIILTDNKLNESSFTLNSLSNCKRPMQFNLLWNKIKYLHESV